MKREKGKGRGTWLPRNLPPQCRTVIYLGRTIAALDSKGRRGDRQDDDRAKKPESGNVAASTFAAPFIHLSIPAFFQILLSNLTTNLWHELKVQGATRSIYNQSLVYRGDFSESQKILLRLNCDEVHASTVVRTEDIGLELSAGMIAGGACVGFALILAVLAVALWRKYFNESYYYLDESPSTPVIADFLVKEELKIKISIHVH